MDAVALAMLADLGLERRDVVSAPEEVSKNGRVRIDPREQARVLADVQARRAKYGGEANGEEDLRAARLRAWNSK